MIYQFSVFSLNQNDGNDKNRFWALCGKILPLVLKYPVSFVPGSARCSSALCLFWLFSIFHCKDTHIDMGIPKIPACRGTSLASICTFRISDFKNFVDKTTSCSKPLFSSFERFCHPATSSTILVIFKLSL